MPKSLQGFIKEVDDEVLEVSREIRPDEYEASAVLAYLENRSEWPLVHFTNPLGIGGADTSPGNVSLASNVFADRKRIARAMGLER
ncbi:MAG: UbiD family decarboxylase, partial [Halobacteriales archaeon]|nr:UbiD family decarboxylase [Halobacteriales archaeon]